MSKRYNYDILINKIFMSLLVVGIHVFKNNDEINVFEFVVFQGFSRVAVPCLFIYSAYFFYKKKNAFREKYSSYVKRMGRLMFSWAIITIPYILYSVLYVPYRDKGYSFLLIFFQNILSPRVNGCWFLYACIICPGVLYILRNCQKILWFLSVVFSIICVLLTSWSFILPENLIESYNMFSAKYVSLFNCFLIGIVYFLIGKYIAETESDELLLYKYRRIGLAVTMILFIVEIGFVWNMKKYPDTDCYFSLIPLTYFITTNSVEGKIKILRHKEYWAASTVVVFIAQFSTIYYLQAINRRIGIAWLENPWILYFIVVGIGYMLTAIIIRLRKITGWKVLGCLY